MCVKWSGQCRVWQNWRLDCWRGSERAYLSWEMGLQPNLEDYGICTEDSEETEDIFWWGATIVRVTLNLLLHQSESICLNFNKVIGSAGIGQGSSEPGVTEPGMGTRSGQWVAQPIISWWGLSWNHAGDGKQHSRLLEIFLWNKGCLGSSQTMVYESSEPQYLYLDAAYKVCFRFLVHSLLYNP